MFHEASQAIRRRGVYQLKDLANMDQTPLPFVLDDGKTYDKTGVDEVWCASGASGLDKRQCTVQLTIYFRRWRNLDAIDHFSRSRNAYQCSREKGLG